MWMKIISMDSIYGPELLNICLLSLNFKWAFEVPSTQIIFLSNLFFLEIRLVLTRAIIIIKLVGLQK